MMYLWLIIASLLSSCIGVKAYEKEHLLGPLMDDAALQSLNFDYRSNTVAPYERLSLGGAGSSGSSSCPTCGG